MDFLVRLPEQMVVEIHLQIPGMQDPPGMRRARALDFPQTGHCPKFRSFGA
jgi:hypothetical protein